MTVPLLVAALVRQTTVLVAQLATTGGVRAPLAQVADQVFLDLVRELERQGISRKVSADMFGMGLRSYLRRIQRLSESSTELGQSLWEAVLTYLHESGAVTRGQILERFYRDEEVQVRAVLHDLTTSGLVFASGTGTGSVYRAAGEDELGALARARGAEGLDELIWALVYRMGPIGHDELEALAGPVAPELDATLTRLATAGRIQLETTPQGARYFATTFVVGRGTTAGFEASVFDHFQAVVQTICCRLRGETTSLPIGELDPADVVGGSTYTFDLWPEHPLVEKVVRTLADYRTRMSALRADVEAYNAEVGLPVHFEQVTSYAGQCVIPQDGEPA